MAGYGECRDPDRHAFTHPRHRRSRAASPSAARIWCRPAALEVAHYVIGRTQVEAEIDRVRTARNAVAEELQQAAGQRRADGPDDAPPSSSALLDVHLMILRTRR